MRSSVVLSETFVGCRATSKRGRDERSRLTADSQALRDQLFSAPPPAAWVPPRHSLAPVIGARPRQALRPVNFPLPHDQAASRSSHGAISDPSSMDYSVYNALFGICHAHSCIGSLHS